MRLNVLLNRVLDWPAIKFEKFQAWMDEGRQWPAPPKPSPLAKRCYLMSESHLSGYRLIVGFESLEDVQEAHSLVASIRPTEQTHNA